MNKASAWVAAAVLVCSHVAGAAEVVLSDPFDGSGKVPWQPTQGDWQRRDGAYHIAGNGETYLSGVIVGDLQVEVEVRIADYGPIPADWVGIIAGGDSTGAKQGHLVYLRYTGEIELFHGGRILAARLTSAASDIKAGRFVKLAVTVKGTHFTVQVNGATYIEYDAPDYEPGSVGLATYGVTADLRNFRLQAQAAGNAIRGEVLLLPAFLPVSGARVEIYDSMDGYNSLVTRQTVADARGRFNFSDLPAGERAYWLRAAQPGVGGTTGWFVTVTDTAPSTQELYLVPAPRHDIWIDSAAMKTTGGALLGKSGQAATAKPPTGFRQVDDPQCFGGSRIEVKETRPSTERPVWWAEFEFSVTQEADYVPYLAAGLYPQPHYWSDYWWSIDGRGPFQATRTLTMEGPRYGDRATCVWAYGPPQHLQAGRHTLRLVLRDPAPHAPGAATLAYSWTFDAAALAALPVLTGPAAGEQVGASRPELRWRGPGDTDRFTVQYSAQPDFSNGTVTLANITSTRLTVPQALADGSYYWRVKALPAGDSCFRSPFSKAAQFVVATAAPAVSDLRVTSRTSHEAVIEWRTDEPCTCTLKYGLSALELAQMAPASTRPAVRHRVCLTGLQPMTYYYYAVEALDQEGHRVTSLRRGFSTARGVIGDRNSPFGMFGQGLTYVRELGRAGAKWYSDYWDWATINPAPGVFRWQLAEDRMRRAQDAGVNLTVTFWGTPEWVRPSHLGKFTYGPDRLDDARAFFREVAAHCRGRTDWWLPWIEPNVARDTVFGFPEGYWASRPHAQSYAAYQRAAYEGAKAGDPNCRVVGMETAGVDLDFIGRCYDEGAADSFDVMNVHYYAITAPFEEQQPETLFGRLRALMAQYGDSEKPILCSEGGGASSGLPGTNEALQADSLVRIFVLSIANNIDELCWTFELDEKPYGSKRTDMIMWMGLFRFDPRVSPASPIGEPKPSYFAFRTMTDNLYSTEYAGPLKLGTDVRAYRFVSPTRRVTVLWAEKGEAEVALPLAAARATLINVQGGEQPLTVAARRVSLHLTGSPLYVREELAP